ncbi:MAG: septal ring lytic transglycosylase RlpA family protein [Treponema sp.]|nr:septal ring lytic transglycosylase RlpA family protein [Treponema sp.]
MKRRILLVAALLISVVPVFADYVYKSEAVASYYADKFHGRKTSNGETFNMYALTAAHKTLPFNTKVVVTNLSNGKNVTVRINDRGPFIAGREIDLSKAAAEKLDMIKSGTAKVKITIIDAKIQNSSSSPYLKQENKSKTWDIQLGAFSVRKNAEAFVKKLQAAGINKYLAYQTAGNITRVVIKDIATNDVQGFLNLLDKKGFEYFVRERAKVKQK